MDDGISLRQMWGNYHVQEKKPGAVSLHTEMSASVMWKRFHDIMQMAIEKFVPKRPSDSKKKKPLCTKSLIKELSRKNTNCGKWQETKDANTELKYKKQVKKASKAVKLAKKNFEKQIAKKIKSDPKLFYSYVKSKTKSKSAVGPLTNSLHVVESTCDNYNF